MPIMSSRTRPIVRVIVLDGVDWKYIHEKPHLVPELFELSNAGGVHCGCCAMLRACEAPITPCAVCALLTGRDDVEGWFTEDRFATSQELIRTRPWFFEAARMDLTVGLVNVPLTWPAFRLPPGSWVTSGFPVLPATLHDASRPWHWPPSLPVGDYPIEELTRDNVAGGTRDLPMLRGAEERIVDWTIKASPGAHIEFVWLRATDSAGHHYWGTPEYDETLRWASIQAGRLANANDPANVLVISDHGFDALSSPRCDAYKRTSHGPAAERANLRGGHSEEGILFARGEQIHARGYLPEQKLVEVAGGLFDLLQLPPAPGMLSKQPAWSAPMSSAEAEAGIRTLKELGY